MNANAKISRASKKIKKIPEREKIKLFKLKKDFNFQCF
jgi:hypothetical protein